MADHFLITGPAVISFSGGRTSAYMLWRILQAHGGTLPDDVVVCFANTGREMPATLDFVQRCASDWGVRVRWVEYRYEPGKHLAVEVSHNSAARKGEPFEHVLRSRSMLPNPVMRFCTVDLKIRTMLRFIQQECGWKRWTQVVGLRADEMRRVERATDPAKQKKASEPGWVICPLAAAGVTKFDVLAFWRAQNFDLMLSGPWEGNCDGCFLKSRASVMRLHRDHPERMKWWADIEIMARGRADNPAMSNFRVDRESYATLAELVRRTPLLPMDETMHELAPACDGGCGV